MAIDREYCAEVAAAEGEALIGTADVVDAWILLEYLPAWTAKATSDNALAQLLLDVARDEGRYCVMLRSHVKRLGGTPTDATGVFYEKLMAREGLAEQLKLLDRGQSAVVRMIDAALPRIADASLRDDFVEMRETHIRNIARCAAVSI